MSTTTSTDTCPSCGERGKAVKLLTVHSLAVAPDSLPQEDPGYRFCQTHGCAVVYYPTAEPVAVLELADVHPRVGQKHPGAPTPFCYCFDHTEEDIRDQLAASGSTTIPASIRAEIQAGNCTCEITNPQGSCCLGNVQAAVNRYTKELA